MLGFRLGQEHGPRLRADHVQRGLERPLDQLIHIDVLEEGLADAPRGLQFPFPLKEFQVLVPAPLQTPIRKRRRVMGRYLYGLFLYRFSLHRPFTPLALDWNN